MGRESTSGKEVSTVNEYEDEVIEDKELFNESLSLSKHNVKQLDKIVDNLHLAEQRKEDILNLQYENYLDDIEYQNHIIQSHNESLEYANRYGIQFWKTYDKSTIYYSINKFSKKMKVNQDRDLYSLLDIHIKVYDTIKDVQFTNKHELLLIVDYLSVVEDDIFYPHSYYEWVLIENIRYRNTFQSTSFLEKIILLKYKKNLEDRLENSFNNSRKHIRRRINPPIDQLLSPRASTINEYKLIPRSLDRLTQKLEIKESIIDEFIYFITEDENYTHYIMNWLAHFFQTLEKTNTALVLVGNIEVSNILIKEIIQPIFAYKKEYISHIDDNTLKKPNETIIKDKIFYHIGELSKENITNKKTSRLVMDILKPNRYHHEEAIENNETYIWGQLIVTAERETPFPFLKDSYSQCSVFKIKNMETILKELELDRITFESLIQEDLDNFSNILAQYDVDNYNVYRNHTAERDALSSMRNGVLMTPELNENIEHFIKNIEERNLEYFQNIKTGDLGLYEELEHNFTENMIAQPLISQYFNLVYGDIIFYENDHLLKILKNKSSIFVKTPTDQSKHLGKKRYAIING